MTLFGRHRAPPTNSTLIKCVLPTELIVHILYHTDPRDIVRWRTVSKWFCAITHNSLLWNVLYANTSLIRPPGPFPSQPTASLERMLVRSARLAQSWASKPLSTVSQIQIPLNGSLASYIDLVDGRWLITCQSNRRFVLYETFPGSEVHSPQILWEQEAQIVNWDMCAVVSEGQWVVYVLLSEQHSQRWRLIELRLDGESGILRDAIAFDVPENEDLRGFVPRIKGGRSPFLLVEPLRLVFDTRTHLFYEFPEFHIALDEIRQGRPIGNPTVLTHTHVLEFFDCSLQGPEMIILVQAFTAPDEPLATENRKRTLRFSHEGLFFDLFPYILIQNSFVDPITGAIGVKFLSQWDFFYNPHCVDMMLPKASSVDGVMQMSINSQGVVTRTNELFDRKVTFHFNLDFLTSSGDGYARGLFTLTDGNPLSYGMAVAKYTVDATQDRCTISMGGVCPLPPEWARFYYMPDRVLRIHFDGVFGRLYYARRREEDADGTLIVVDVE